MPISTIPSAGLDSQAQFIGFKNRIINGDMRIDQRNNGASVTVTDAYTLDRWEVREDTDGVVAFQQVSDAPVGFTQSARITTTVADASLTGTQRLIFRQPIEGNNVADLAFGTASASAVALSFWVKSSLTGTFGGALTNSGSARSYPFNYTINAANTWEQKTVTVPGDTSGTWLTNNGIGLNVLFGLGVGPDNSGTAGAWVTASRLSTTGAVSVIGTAGATWQVTGVQLERGTTATSFEVIDYGRQLIQCQRYYEEKPVDSSSYSMVGWPYTAFNTNGWYSWSFKVTKRASPTVTGSTYNAYPSIEGVTFNNTTGTVLTTVKITASAEL